MTTLEIINEAKQMKVLLEVEDNMVYSARVLYDKPIPLSDFIQCSAIVRVPSGCGNPVTVRTSTQRR